MKTNSKNIKQKNKITNKTPFWEETISIDGFKIKNKFTTGFFFLIYKLIEQIKVVLNLKFITTPQNAKQRTVKSDKVIFWILVFLSVLGLGALYSSYTFNIFQNENVILGFLPQPFIKQIGFFIISWLVYYLILKKFNIYYLKNINLILLFIFAAMVLLTVVAGNTNNTSAKRWLNLGIIVVQPAELGKLIFPLIGAYIVSNYKVFKFRYLLNSVSAYITIISLLIMFSVFKLMPDTGTTIAYVIIFVCMLSVANISDKAQKGLAVGLFAILTIIIIGVVFFPNLATKLSTTSKFQGGRITSWLNPFSDVKNQGYQLVSSIIAIAKGSLFGRGLGNGTQKLGWLPEAESDFIFSNIAEEIGLFGVIVIFIIFIILFVRLYKKINLMKDVYLKTFAFGALAGIYANIFINLGGISGAIPMSGVPLPFFSAGVTNLIITFITLALIQVAIITDQSKNNNEIVYDDLLQTLAIKKTLKIAKIKEKKLLKKQKRKIVKVKKGNIADLKKDKKIKIKKIKRKKGK